MSYYHNLGPRQGPQYLKYKIMQGGQQLFKRNSVIIPGPPTLPSPPHQALSAYLDGLSLHNSIIPLINSWYQFQLHTCLNENPPIFPLAASQIWEAPMDTLLTNTCTIAGLYLEYLWIQAFPMTVFIQATWSQLPMSINLLGIIRFKVKINFLPNILHGFKKINLISTMHFKVQAKWWKNQRSCKSN